MVSNHAVGTHGTGKAFYGERDYQPDGSYVSTEWVIFFHVPLFPLRSVRLGSVVLGAPPVGDVATQYVVGERCPLNLKQVAGTYLLLFLAGLITYAGFTRLPALARMLGIDEATALFLPVPLAGLPFLAVLLLRMRAKKRAGFVSPTEHSRRASARIESDLAGRPICPPHRLSGRVGHSLWLVPVAGAVLTLFLAGIYAWIDLNWRSYEIVAVLQTIIFAVLVAAATGWLIRSSKCRNLFVARLLGCTAGLFSVYVAWVWFEFFLLQKVETERVDARVWSRLFFEPRLVYAIGASLNESGTFSESRENQHHTRVITGFELGLVWLGEAALIIFINASMPGEFIRHRLFCERCKLWGRSWPKPILLQPSINREAEVRAAHGDLSALGELSFCGKTPVYPLLRLSIQQCPCCAEAATYALDWLWAVKGSSGMETKTSPLTAPRLLPAHYAAELRAAAEANA